MYFEYISEILYKMNTPNINVKTLIYTSHVALGMLSFCPETPRVPLHNGSRQKAFTPSSRLNFPCLRRTKHQNIENIYKSMSNNFSYQNNTSTSFPLSCCGVVFFTSPFHLGGRHARPFTRNLEEGKCPLRDEF